MTSTALVGSGRPHGWRCHPADLLRSSHLNGAQKAAIVLLKLGRDRSVEGAEDARRSGGHPGDRRDRPGPVGQARGRRCLAARVRHDAQGERPTRRRVVSTGHASCSRRRSGPNAPRRSSTTSGCRWRRNRSSSCARPTRARCSTSSRASTPRPSHSCSHTCPPSSRRSCSAGSSRSCSATSRSGSPEARTDLARRPRPDGSGTRTPLRLGQPLAPRPSPPTVCRR